MARVGAWVTVLVLALAGCAGQAGSQGAGVEVDVAPTDSEATSEPTAVPAATSEPEPAATETAPTPEPTREATELGLSAAETTVTGTVAGDTALEGGCVWIETEQGSIIVQPADGAGFTTDTQALAYLGSDGQPIVSAGDEVRITGRPAENMMTFCQTGQPWLVSAIEPA